MSDIDVTVVGGGPYGLSLAPHLRASGAAFRIFGKPMASWLEHMPKGMYLRSEGFASNISDPTDRFTLAAFCAETGHDYADYGLPVSLDTFGAYGLWFRERAVPELERSEVARIERSGNGFAVGLANGDTFSTRRVVVATGIAGFAYTPTSLRMLPPELRSHSYDHADLSTFAGRSVAVVGGGQSALETAALLHEHGATPHVFVRGPLIRWNGVQESGRRPLYRRMRAPLGGLGLGWKTWVYSSVPVAFYALPERTRLRLVKSTLGPAGGWWLRDRFEPHVEVATSTEVALAREVGGRIELTLLASDCGRRQLLVDHVLAATGYRVDLERLSFLDEELRRAVDCVEGSPRLSRSFESSVRGLSFVGLASATAFGPVMRFVFGTKYTSSAVARQLSERAPRARPMAAAATR